MGRLQEGDYDGENPAILLWPSHVRRGIAGKRGQVFLKELRDILLAMPEKRLVKDDWITPGGDVCVLGAYLRAKDASVTPENANIVEDKYYGDEGPFVFAEKFNLPKAMCWDLEYRNDEYGWRDESPEAVYERMLQHIQELIKE